ncbi:MAG: hypothetical protein LBH39_07595, partial [Clostridiales Family XIII bacterium]|jgi:hypothetical protein|nr:hypothetical protein [Clostridiales Family XIII bacterium]
LRWQAHYIINTHKAQEKERYPKKIVNIVNNIRLILFPDQNVDKICAMIRRPAALRGLDGAYIHFT